MPIARLIYITVDAGSTDDAIRAWKEQCAPLMISVQGCLREELLRSLDDPAELISYSEWASVEDIERYRSSDAHRQIKEHTSGLRSDVRPVVKLYEVAG